MHDIESDGDILLRVLCEYAGIHTKRKGEHAEQQGSLPIGFVRSGYILMSVYSF